MQPATFLHRLARQRLERAWERVTTRQARAARALIIWTLGAQARAAQRGEDTSAYDAFLADLVPQERAVGERARCVCGAPADVFHPPGSTIGQCAGCFMNVQLSERTAL